MSSLSRSSPVIFPSASPNLYMSLSKKVPEAKPWQEITPDYRYSLPFEESALRIRCYRFTTILPPSDILDLTLDEDSSLSEESLESHVSLSSQEEAIDSPSQQDSMEKISKRFSLVDIKTPEFIGFSKDALSRIKRTTVGI